MKFPFNENENTACFTCCHILDNNADICYVSHDQDDGSWQFMCGLDDHEISDGCIVSLKELFDLDNSIGQLANLPLGSYFDRFDKNSPWK